MLISNRTTAVNAYPTSDSTAYTVQATAETTSAATSYPTSQNPGYAVQHTAQTYAAATPRATQAAGYESYQTAQAAAAAAAYQYASRQQTTYDKTQSYYPQATQVYSAADTTHYQTGTATSKATYSANATGYGTARAANAKAATTQGAATSYVYSTNSAGSGGYSSYNSPGMVYPSMYVQGSSQQAAAAAAAIGATTAAGVAQSVSAAASSAIKGQNNSWAGFKKGGFMKSQKAKQPPKPQQLHYCDVCKISCAGPQTYREHLEGQKHKKKEAAAKAGAIPPSSRGGTSLRCELCDVTCTGSDAYAAHIRGTKHQKVVKLHTKLGKPIPSTEPVVLATSSSSAKTKPTAKSGGANDKKILGTPKINFVGGTKLNTTTPDMNNSNSATPSIDDDKSMDEDKNDIYDDKADIQPVGQDYIDEIRNDDGKVISFQCKLCECRFNDPNAKEMHMKGRRHRLQYKKKVNPDLVVDIKPSLRQRKIQEDRMRRQQMRDEMWKRREEERWRDEMRMMEEEERMYWEERRRYEEEMEYYEMFRRYGRDPHMLPPPMMPPRGFMGPPRGPPGPNMGPPMPPRRPDSVDDRHIMAKHTAVYPKEEELGAVQKIVTNTEKALKQVSDFLAEADAPLETKKEVVAKKEPEVKKEATTESETDGEKEKDKEDKEEANQMPNRTLKGVMRVGVLAKGLLLTGDNNVQLVVMCAEKPTRTLLDRVADNLPKQFAVICPDETYEVKRCVEEAAIKVLSTTEPKVSITVMLTSPVMRDGPEKEGAEAAGEIVKDPPDVLDRQKCLDALAALRHAKWFQARASVLQSCVMIIRIMRDLCQRVPTWGRMSTWAMELLVEKVIFSSGQYMSPGDALRRVFEAIAGGILLPGGPGILDPCEKEPTDASAALTNQDREDITSSAQYALRLIAFRQIHKVLGMDPLPPPKFTRGPFPRKRRRDNSSGEGNESEGGDGKKDKKEEVPEMETNEVAEKK